MSATSNSSSSSNGTFECSNEEFCAEADSQGQPNTITNTNGFNTNVNDDFENSSVVIMDEIPLLPMNVNVINKDDISGMVIYSLPQCY